MPEGKGKTPGEARHPRLSSHEGQAHNPGAFSHLYREGTCTKQAEQAARCSGVSTLLRGQQRRIL